VYCTCTFLYHILLCSRFLFCMSAAKQVRGNTPNKCKKAIPSNLPTVHTQFKRLKNPAILSDPICFWDQSVIFPLVYLNEWDPFPLEYLCYVCFSYIFMGNHHIWSCKKLKFQYRDVILFFKFALKFVRKIRKKTFYTLFDLPLKNPYFLYSHNIFVLTPILDFISEN